MTPEDSKSLRHKWKAKGNLNCTHPSLVVEEDNSGFLTGAHVCIVCGARVKIAFILDSNEH